MGCRGRRFRVGERGRAGLDDAQDMPQETFLRAWNKRESFRGDAAPRTWLYWIAGPRVTAGQE
ncbi:sigma factor [Nocardia cyriacigeorgica]|uniref:sigma factor n=1 Tax=Nocardia cyriacigeorgica TaxID=135487 RepID=UPI0024B55DBF|nr:sigma factor [Nocardia cyriacigeorgica]